jgi:hypothetical protein
MVVYAHNLGNQRQVTGSDFRLPTGRKWQRVAGWVCRAGFDPYESVANGRSEASFRASNLRVTRELG